MQMNSRDCGSCWRRANDCKHESSNTHCSAPGDAEGTPIAGLRDTGRRIRRSRSCPDSIQLGYTVCGLVLLVDRNRRCADYHR